VRQSNDNPRRRSTLFVRLGAALGLCFALALFVTGTALATYEQVGTFAGKPGPLGVPGEEVQFAGVSGIAVNSTGAGGVPAGTIYAATNELISGVMVARYNPNRSFSEAWRVETSFVAPYRCGPDGEPAHPTCAPREFANAEQANDVEVDQATGDVYVVTNQLVQGRAADGVVDVYSPDGSKLIAHFAQQSTEEKATSADPEEVTRPGGLAVGTDGTVYLADENNGGAFFHHRIMVWKPVTAGDYEHYAYAGESHDIASGVVGEAWPEFPVLDDAGNIYGSQDDVISEYSPAEPSKPVCKFDQPDAGVTDITVDPRNGEVFYFDYKNRKIHELAPCDGSGEFKETGTIAVAPPSKETRALGFDPASSWAVGRPAGVLYAGSAQAEVSAHESSLGYIFAPPEEAPPAISGEQVAKVGSGAALLQGSVSADGVRTHYTFQYLSTSAYEANPAGERFAGALEAPLGGGFVEGTKAVPVSAGVTGLIADTSYRFRLVASSHCSPGEPGKVCEADGVAEELHTYASEAGKLPDGRAYELVSPVDKQGGEVVPAYPLIGSCYECKPGTRFVSAPMQSAPNGESIVYDGTPFSPTEGAVGENSYYAQRTATGWQTTFLSPKNLTEGNKQGYQGFSRDLTAGVLFRQENSPSEYYPNLYARRTEPSAVFSRLIPVTPPNRPPGHEFDGFRVAYAGASQDLSHVFFSANDALTEATPVAPAAQYSAEDFSLYEAAGGGLRLVNVKPGNVEVSPGAEFGAGVAHDGSRVVSDNGSRVFWASGEGKSYVRIDGETTREIPDASAHYLTASSDGSRVLMSDGKIFDHLEEETPTEEFDLTNGKGGFQGVAGQSEDLSVLYFVDNAVLDETPNAWGKTAENGKDNLYFWKEGTPRFITTLASTDGELSKGNDWEASPLKRSAEASPNGRWLAFASAGELTGYDNVGPCETIHGSGEKLGTEREYASAPCEEVFIYNSATETLECASCNRSGSRPLGNAIVRLDLSAQGEQPRYLTNSGRLFFDSGDSLAPADTNGHLEDVYEFEPAGVGSCTVARGCISLISAGTGAGDSNLVAVDESGKNVFFTTRDQLVHADRDDAVDLYDAREDGGIPAQSETVPVECEAEACLPATAPASTSIPGGSLTFTGPGNLLAPPPVKPTGAAITTKTTISGKAKLTKALRSCRKDKSKARRAQCEKRARRTYGPQPKPKIKSRKGGK